MNIKTWLAIFLSAFLAASLYSYQVLAPMADYAGPEKPTVSSLLVSGIIVALLFELVFILPLSIVVRRSVKFRKTIFIALGIFIWFCLWASFSLWQADSSNSVVANTLIFMPPGVVLVLAFVLFGGLVPNKSFKFAPSGRDVPYRHAP